MKTRVIRVLDDLPKLQEPAEALRQGQLVVFPTETVYGLGVHALRTEAIAQVYQVKGRPSDNPLIVHIADWCQLQELTPPLSPLARFLMERFWPGPATFVLPKLEQVPLAVSGGLNTVGIRMPAHPVARALIRRAGVPVAAPSANRSGRPSPTCLQDCLEDLEGRVPYIIDGGPCSVGVESTVIALTGGAPRILRPGQIGVQELEAALQEYSATEEKRWKGQIEEAYRKQLEEGETPEAPGMKYRHYAPQAEVRVVDCGLHPEREASWAEAVHSLGVPFGYVGCQEGAACLQKLGLNPQWSFVYGHLAEVEQATRFLFASLRALDRLGCPVVLTHALPEKTALAVAYNNRLFKAVGGGSLPEEG